MSALVAATLGVAVVAAGRGIWSPCGLSMVSAINPMAERARGYRYWLTAVWFIAGSLAGSAAIGLPAAVGALGLRALGLDEPARMMLVGLIAILTLAAEVRLFGLGLPRHPRQVNELWLMQYRRWVYSAGFGVQIGSGFATYIMTTANYLLLGLTLVSGRPGLALAGWLAFGLVRGLAVLLSLRCRSAARLAALHRRLAGWDGAAGAVARWSQAIVAGLAGFVLAGPVAALAGMVLSSLILRVGRIRQRRGDSRAVSGEVMTPDRSQAALAG